MADSIVAAFVPFQKPNDCGEITEVPCGGEITTDKVSGDFGIVYPTSVGNTLPLSGGAIIKLDISSLGINPSQNISNVINRNLNSLSGLSLFNSMESLVNVRNAVNNAYIGIRNVKVVSEDNKRIKAPDLFYSILVGDDSSLKDTIASPDVNKVCGFSYIPASAIARTLDIIAPADSDFENVIGTSGRTFGSLRDSLVSGSGNSVKLSNSANESDILDAVLELFPIYNISEGDITKRRGSPTLGGFYTVFEDSIYVKMPDVSGRDSAGFSSDVYAEEDTNLYMEVLAGASLKRVKFSDFLAPPAAIVLEPPDEFPTTGTADISLISSLGPSDISRAYLSIIAKDQTVASDRSVDNFSNGIELFSIPMLTKVTLDQTGGLPTILPETLGTDDGLLDIKPLAESDFITLDTGEPSSRIGQYFASFDIETVDQNDLGIPYFSAIETGASNFFGEKNRPEILLGDRDSLSSSRKNDRKYFRPQAYGDLEVLSQNRPRIYDEVPSLWIATNDKGTDDDDNLVIKFSAASLADVNINSSTLAGEAEFALYLEDSIGQIARVPGINIILSTPTPAISSIKPSGFSGGGGRVELDFTGPITIEGEGLKNAQALRFGISGTEEANLTTIPLQDNENYTVNNSSDTRLEINFITPISQNGFSQDSSIYDVRVSGVSGQNSNATNIFVANPDDALPAQVTSPAEFRSEEFTAIGFGKGAVAGVPLLANGSSAEIRIKSKQKLFSGSFDLFGYLALPNTTENQQIAKKFATNEDLVILSNPDNIDGVDQVLIVLGIQYDFTSSPVGDFSRLSNKRAKLKFPGTSYANVNFSDLINTDKAFFVFTGQSLREIVSSSPDSITEFSLESSQYGYIQIGDNDNAAFVKPPVISGIYAELPGSTTISSTAAVEDGKDNDIIELFDGNPIDPSGINAFDKINTLVVAFSGIDDGIFLRRNYTFKLGADKLNSKISRKIRQRDNGKELIAVFSNVSTKQEGTLNLTIEKKEKRFNTTLTSDRSIAQATAYYPSGTYSIDEDGFANTSVDVDSVIEIDQIDSLAEGAGAILVRSGELSDNTRVMESLIPPNGTGIQIDQVNSQGDFYKFFTPVSFLPTVDIVISEEADKTTKILRGQSQGDIFGLSRLVLSIPSGAFFAGGEYVTDSSGNMLGFIKNQISDPAAINFNVPEVFALSTSKNSERVVLEELGDDTVTIIAGTEIEVYVRNSKRNFVVIMDGIALNPKGRPERVKGAPEGTYKATIEIPIVLAGKTVDSSGSCFDVCASTSNANRKGAKLALGTEFVIDIDAKMQELLFGPLKDKMPDINDLKEKLLDFPLRFLQVKLEKSMIPKDLINSFCDLSFHLTADLNLALQGFQTLLIPIQVIFCIIDVICALLNPVKIAKAVIRLFQCLYDLLLLLPQISVPVMFLQLILHLLELIKCVIDKILGTIFAINAIITAIDRAAKDLNWVTIQALEEVLSEYLFEIEGDLQVFEPVISILAIFLQLLQLAFRFPCSVTPGDGDPACGLDGSMLAGIVGGILAPDDAIVPDALIPVGQGFTEVEIEDAAQSNNGSEPYEEYNDGDKVGSQSDGSTFLDSMNVDSDTLRSTASFQFQPTYGPTFTKSTKGFGDPRIVKFKFNGRGRNGFFRNRKVIDPLQTIDDPLALMQISGDDMQIRDGGDKGNFISPIDGFRFMNVDGNKGTIKPLVLTFELPILEANEETGEIEEVGVETVTRTFDDIPSMAIMDEEFNLYFVEPKGIEFDGDGNVDAIKAKLQSFPTARKLKFSKEDQEIDTDDDDEADDETGVFDFPQFYFFDMRQAQDEIQQACYSASLNSFLLENGDNIDDIVDIIEEGQDCIDAFLSGIRGATGAVRDSMNAGEVPAPISVEDVSALGDSYVECLGDVADRMCRYVVNTLNTSFRIVEDDDETPLEAFPDIELDEELLGDFEEDTPALTGAREYAAGIGDSASIGLGEEANIIITIRDSYDIEIDGDFSDRVLVEIVSDTTGDAELVPFSDGSLVQKNGGDYFLKLTSNQIGEVKLRAKVCDRTIQAVTFDGTVSDLEVDDNALVDCVPESVAEATDSSPSLGALTKVDRILTVFFIRRSTVALADDSGDRGSLAISDPQEFGTSLEN